MEPDRRAERQGGGSASESSRAHEEIAKLFIATVQGDISTRSCVVQHGQLVGSNEPIGRGSGRNLAIVAQLLRGPAPLPALIEQWLVSLFDQHKTGSNDADPWEASTCRIK